MESNYHHILAGYVETQNLDVVELKQAFQDLIATCNLRFQQRLLSPYTISTGNEFIGVADSQKSLLETVFYLEEESLNRQVPFRVRYVALEGTIDTPINSKTAHGMIGVGLKEARDRLVIKSRGKPRIQFYLRDYHTINNIQKLFIVIDGIVSRWKKKDGPLIIEMINHKRDSIVGDIFNKSRSQIWKRRGNLQITEYCIIKDLILEHAPGLTHNPEGL